MLRKKCPKNVNGGHKIYKTGKTSIPCNKSQQFCADAWMANQTFRMSDYGPCLMLPPGPGVTTDFCGDPGHQECVDITARNKDKVAKRHSEAIT